MNTHQTPPADLADAADAADAAHAAPSLRQRLAATALDGLLAAVFSLPFFYVLLQAYGLLWQELPSRDTLGDAGVWWVQLITKGLPLLPAALGLAALTALLMLLPLALLGVLEATGGTPGQHALGLRVLHARTLRRPGVLRASWRQTCKWGLNLGLPGLFFLLDRWLLAPHGAHNLLSACRVVRRHAPEAAVRAYLQPRAPADTST